jgi:excinuclease ABC subunit B
MSVEAIQKAIQKNKKAMQDAVKELDFVEAARLRDEITDYENLMNQKKEK